MEVTKITIKAGRPTWLYHYQQWNCRKGAIELAILDGVGARFIEKKILLQPENWTQCMRWNFSKITNINLKLIIFFQQQKIIKKKVVYLRKTKFTYRLDFNLYRCRVLLAVSCDVMSLPNMIILSHIYIVRWRKKK